MLISKRNQPGKAEVCLVELGLTRGHSHNCQDTWNYRTCIWFLLFPAQSWTLGGKKVMAKYAFRVRHGVSSLPPISTCYVVMLSQLLVKEGQTFKVAIWLSWGMVLYLLHRGNLEYSSGGMYMLILYSFQSLDVLSLCCMGYLICWTCLVS